MTMGELAVLVSILAFLCSLWSAFQTTKYSNISVIHSLHQLVLQKANDCNALFQKTQEEIQNLKSQFTASWKDDTSYIPTISEVIISIQLLDNSLANYSQTKKRDFYLKQFWTQLNTSVREFFKNLDHLNFPEPVTQKQVSDIKETFSHLFRDY